jgi:hypothetical protein
MSEHVGRFGHPELGIDRHHDRADAREREQQQHVRIAVSRHDCDAVAFADAAPGEHARGVQHRLVELPPAPRFFGTHHEVAVGAAAHAARKRACERVVVLRVKTDDFERAFHWADSDIETFNAVGP